MHDANCFCTTANLLGTDAAEPGENEYSFITMPNIEQEGDLEMFMPAISIVNKVAELRRNDSIP